MADAKISALSAVTDVLDTDEFVLARSGVSNKIDGVDLKAKVLASLAFTPYTPALTAVTTNPTLGTGSSVAGRYVRVGSFVFVLANVTFGTSGTAAGSGVYRISLPLSVSSSNLRFSGSAFLYDASPATARVAACDVVAASDWVTLWVDSAASEVTHASPWAWSASDQLNVSLVYETDA